jgi:Leucine rich repeat/WG containing repeat
MNEFFMNPKIYPFKFLDAYTREDKALFFGRDAEIKALYEMIFQTDLLVVYGASGTGKTSLIQCGLANRFQTHDWLPIPVRRGANLNDSFEKALQTLITQPVVSGADELDWLDESWDDSRVTTQRTVQTPLERTFKAIYLQSFKPIYLIFDQFEELYVLGTRTEQTKFVETIQEVLRIEQPIKILISIREEYLGYLYEFEKQVPELLRKKLRVEPMNLENVTTVIQGIAQLNSNLVHIAAPEIKPLAALIFDKIKDKEKTITIQLPYLQVFLDKFYLHVSNDESRQSEATFSVASLKEMGDLGDILRNFLDHQVLQMAHDLQLTPDQVWLMLSPLVTLEGTKEPTTLQTLAARLPNMPMDTVQKALEAFVQNRVLRLNEQAQSYEVAHDALARQIHAKRSDTEIAILEVQRLVKAQMSLKASVRDYFTEKQLLFMEPYLPKLVLSATEQKWIADSRAFRTEEKAAEERRKTEELTRARETAKKEKQLREAAEIQQQLAKRRTRIAISVALFALIAAGAALWQYQEANTAKNKAQTAEKKAINVLDKIYFYDGKFGLAYDKNSQKYGFIDPNLNTKIEFKYKEALSFDYDGFAKVKKEINEVPIDFLIDTLGYEYKLTTGIKQLDSTITVLDLRDQKLDRIPPAVFRKKQLKVLLISGNQIRNLSDSVGNLMNLQTLDLSYNELTSLPVELFKLTNLQTLNLSWNKLTSLPVEFGNLTKLKRLELRKNLIPEAEIMILKRSLPNCYIEFDDPITALEYKIGKEQDTTKRILLYDTIIGMLENRYRKDLSNVEVKNSLAHQYNSMAWDLLQQRQFAHAEQIVRRCIQLDATFPYIWSKLAPSLLLQGNYSMAEKEYLRLKDKPYLPERNLPFYKDAFLAQLKEFGAKGIIPKERQVDVEKILALLQKK